MRKLEVSIGEIINDLEVISIDETSKDVRVRLKCKVCGKEFN